jgi:hypothetical protein
MCSALINIFLGCEFIKSIFSFFNQILYCFIFFSLTLILLHFFSFIKTVFSIQFNPPVKNSYPSN